MVPPVADRLRCVVVRCIGRSFGYRVGPVREREATNELVRDRIILHMQHILPPSVSFDPLCSHPISGVATHTHTLSLFLSFLHSLYKTPVSNSNLTTYPFVPQHLHRYYPPAD